MGTPLKFPALRSETRGGECQVDSESEYSRYSRRFNCARYNSTAWDASSRLDPAIISQYNIDMVH